MKIGFISGEFPPMPGGVGDFTRVLAERIGELGGDVYILSRPGSSSQTLKVSTIKGWGLGGVRVMRSWVREHGIDIVNLQYQTAAFDMSPFIHFLPDVLAAPVVTTFHDLRHPYLFPKAGPLRDWIVMRLARSSAGVITTNQEDDLRLRSLPHRRLIPLGSSIPRADCGQGDATSWRSLAGAAAASFVLGHFGFVKAVKGVDYLIEALASLRAEGHDLRLLFIGSRQNQVDSSADASYLQGLDERIAKLGLADAIAWTGYLPDHDVAACFKAVDLVALPYADGASYRRSSLLSAIHNGCPILTTETSVKVESFNHGCNLWLVPPRSAAALEEAIRQLMRDRDQLMRLRAGAAQLSRHFDWDDIARETIAFYETII